MRKILIGVVVAMAACSESKTEPQLGAPCECPESIGYPCDLAGCGDGANCRGGTCAMPCAAGCPDGAICVDDDFGGSCAYACVTADECPGNLDRCDGTCYGGPLISY